MLQYSSRVKKIAQRVSTRMFALLEVLGLPWMPGPGRKETGRKGRG